MYIQLSVGDNMLGMTQVSYRMKLSNDHVLQVAIFVVHSQPREEMSNAEATVGCASYQWTCVSRRE